jgi:hypothetical protein
MACKSVSTIKSMGSYSGEKAESEMTHHRKTQMFLHQRQGTHKTKRRGFMAVLNESWNKDCRKEEKENTCV